METAAIVARLYALLIPIVSDLECAEVECLCPRGMVGFGEHRRVTDPAREVDHFVDQLRPLAKIGAHVIDVYEASNRGRGSPGGSAARLTSPDRRCAIASTLAEPAADSRPARSQYPTASSKSPASSKWRATSSGRASSV